MVNQCNYNLVLNSSVYSEKFGYGFICDINGERDNLRLVICFENDNDKQIRVFSLKFILDNDNLLFEDDITKQLLIEMTQNNEITNNSNNFAQSKNISKNDAINFITNKLLSDENISLFLINYFDNLNFESDLLKEGFSYFIDIKEGKYLSKEYYYLLNVMFAYIALKYYNGDLFSHIINNFKLYYPFEARTFSENQIKNTYYKIMKQYGFLEKVRYKTNQNNRYEAVSVILACVPYYRVDQLFKLSYDIYKKKLLFDEDITDEQIYNKVFDALVILKDKDVLSNSEKIAGTEYLMSKYTQSCIKTGYNLESLVSIISHCIRLIINYLTMLEDAYVVDEYYKEGFNNWVNQFKEDKKEKERYEISKLSSKPYFKLRYTNMIYLITGQCFMEEFYDPNEVRIEIYNNDVLMETQYLTDPNDVKLNRDGVMSGYLINNKIIALKCSPIDRFSYKILSGESEVYSSKQRLYRTAIFFDGKGCEINPGTNYDGELTAVLKKIKNNDNFGYDYRVIFEKESYGIYTLNVNNIDVYRFHDEPYVFYKLSGSKFTGYEIPWASFTTVEGKNYPIYKDASILVQSSCDRKDLIVCLDNHNLNYFKRDAETFSVTLFSKDSNGLNTYFISLKNLKEGFHNVKVFNRKTDKIIKQADFDFIYDRKINKRFVSQNEKSIKYTLMTAFIGEIQEIEYPYGVTNIQIYTFVKGIGYGNLNLYPTIISYSIDSINWFTYDETLKLYNLDKDKKCIYICGPRKMTAFIKDENENLEKRNLPLIQSDDNPFIYQLNIEYLKTLKRQQALYINFKFGEEKCKRLRCKFVPYIVKEKCEIYYDEVNDEYNFKMVFDAISQLLLVVKEGKTNTEIYKKLIYSKELVKLPSSKLLTTTKFFNVYLYKPIGNGLFIKYEEPSIIKFPRVLLGKVHLIHKPRCEYDKSTTSLKFSCVFEGIERLFVKFINNADNSIVYKTSITSDNEFSFNYFVEKLVQLRAFFYYNVDMSTDIESDEVKNLFITDVIDIEPIDLNSLVNKKFVVKEFITEKNLVMKDIVVKLSFTSVVTIKGIKYLCGKLLSSGNEVLKDNMLLNIEKIDGQYVVGNLYRFKDKKMGCIKRHGLKIVKAVIRIYGGSNGKKV